MTPKTYIYVDTENVSTRAPESLPEHVKVFFFLNGTESCAPWLQLTKTRRFETVDTRSPAGMKRHKNQMDFMLVVKLAAHAALRKATAFVLLSKDKGYDQVLYALRHDYPGCTFERLEMDLETLMQPREDAVQKVKRICPAAASDKELLEVVRYAKSPMSMWGALSAEQRRLLETEDGRVLRDPYMPIRSASSGSRKAVPSPQKAAPSSSGVSRSTAHDALVPSRMVSFTEPVNVLKERFLKHHPYLAPNHPIVSKLLDSETHEEFRQKQSAGEKKLLALYACPLGSPTRKLILRYDPFEDSYIITGSRDGNFDYTGTNDVDQALLQMRNKALVNGMSRPVIQQVDHTAQAQASVRPAVPAKTAVQKQSDIQVHTVVQPDYRPALSSVTGLESAIASKADDENDLYMFRFHEMVKN